MRMVYSSAALEMIIQIAVWQVLVQCFWFCSCYPCHVVLGVVIVVMVVLCLAGFAAQAPAVILLCAATGQETQDHQVHGGVQRADEH